MSDNLNHKLCNNLILIFKMDLLLYVRDKLNSFLNLTIQNAYRYQRVETLGKIGKVKLSW